jgi:hypothetical protein
MQTKTFTLLVTVRDDGIAAVFNPIVLAAALKGALESGVPSFMIDSEQFAALKHDPLIRASIGEHNLPPVVVAEVDAFDGDLLPMNTAPMARACIAHRDLREGR